MTDPSIAALSTEYPYCICGHRLTPEHECPTDADSDPCKCGHWRSLHLTVGASCTAQVDKRHVSAGGPQLYPCDCKGFRPMFGGSRV